MFLLICCIFRIIHNEVHGKKKFAHRASDSSVKMTPVSEMCEGSIRVYFAPDDIINYPTDG
jgi:hypothetical protein